MSPPRLILASASPRRRELLSHLGISFDVLPADVDEAPIAGESPLALALRLSRSKAVTLSHKYPDAAVIGADTVVAVSGTGGMEILGKPADATDAAKMLGKLSGKKHVVVTGFSIVCGAPAIDVAQAVSTDVFFRAMSDDEIADYVATGEPLDKAGAYGIQGAGGIFVESITGSYSNVVGLPMCELYLALKKTGVYPDITLVSAI